MSVQDNGGPAFPVADIEGASPANVSEMRAMARGMVLRDYFAAKAMQGILAVRLPEAELGTAAEYAYAVADAMLRARSQP